MVKRGIKALEVHGEATGMVAMEPDRSWDQFLRGLSSPTARQARELWQTLERSGEQIPPPYAVATEGGGISMTWDRGRHHFEIEVLSDGIYDWFYMDRNSRRELARKRRRLASAHRR